MEWNGISIGEGVTLVVSMEYWHARKQVIAEDWAGREKTENGSGSWILHLGIVLVLLFGLLSTGICGGSAFCLVHN